jgi:hypothetical protein
MNGATLTFFVSTYKGKRAESAEDKTRAPYGITQNVRTNTADF